MTTKQYRTALKKLDLGTSTQQTVKVLGLSRRQCIRIGVGNCPVPGPVALLLRIYLAYPHMLAEMAVR